jgi:CRP-like cAMP-binding protein
MMNEIPTMTLSSQTGPGVFFWRKESARSTLWQWKQSGLLSAPQWYPAGASIFARSAAPRDAFLLERGVVAFARDPVTREKSGIGALCLPGNLFGHYPGGLADDSLHSVIALTRCMVYRISREKMLAALQKGGETALFIVCQYLHNLLCARARATESSTKGTKARLEHLLLELASVLEDRGPAGCIRLPLKDKELAGILGISPQQFSVIKKEMEGEKVIACFGQRNKLALRSGGAKIQFFKVYGCKRIPSIASSA